jgi:hypothetical protein
MAYNSGFPMGYQPYYPQYQYQTPQVPASQSQQIGGRVWVSGEAGAKAFILAPNSSAELWDSEQQTIYLKSADASGIPSMKILDYTIRSEAPARPSEDAHSNKHINVSMEDLNALQGQIDALKDEVKTCRKIIEESEARYEQSDLRRRHEQRKSTADESNADVAESQK